MEAHALFSKVLKNSIVLNKCYNQFYTIVNGHSFRQEQERRSTMSFFDIYEVSRDMPYCPIEFIKDSNYYGHAYALKSYSGCSLIKAGIEHGIYLGNRISAAELLNTTKSVIAMSQNRVDSFEQHKIGKPILAIGPYIHYAEPFLDDKEIKSLKNELGKVLLVFPFHSAKGFASSFDIELLIHSIEEYRDGYDTVLVCLHHNDIKMNPQYTEQYINKGYRLVCAGHKYDFKFLSRLKSIISLADFVISNGIGTQVGYCTYLNKPQSIIYDDSCLSAVYDPSAYDAESEQIALEQTMEIVDAYKNNHSTTISPLQLVVAEKYWGLSLIKTPNELKEGILKLNKIS